MGEKTTTRADLADVLHQKIGLSRTESADMVDVVIEEICKALVRGEQVKLSGFGTFKLHEKNARIGRNPKTKEQAVISSRRVVTFGPSNLLKEKVAGRKILQSRQDKIPA